MSEKRDKAKKVVGIVGTVLMYVFLAICIVALVFAISAKRSDDGAVNVFGYEMRIVLTGSMEKSEMTDVSDFAIKDIPKSSMILTQSVPKDNANEWYSKLKVGDVLTFKYLVAGRHETITHRIIGIEDLGDGYKITLRGDNRTKNEGEQVIFTGDEASPNFVLGKVVFKSTAIGYVISVLQKPVGIALIIIVPSVIIIILQIIRIVAAVSEEKHKNARKLDAEKTDEIDRLKRRIAEMEAEKDNGENNGENIAEKEERQ